MANAVISQTCPIGDCPITVTWEYGKPQADEPGFLAAGKKRLREHLQTDHKNGIHKQILKEFRAKQEAQNG